MKISSSLKDKIKLFTLKLNVKSLSQSLTTLSWDSFDCGVFLLNFFDILLPRPINYIFVKLRHIYHMIHLHALNSYIIKLMSSWFNDIVCSIIVFGFFSLSGFIKIPDKCLRLLNGKSGVGKENKVFLVRKRILWRTLYTSEFQREN